MSYETQRTVVPTTFAADSGTYVDWSAIIGGIVLASAISVVMLAFGSAAGLSFSTTLASGKTASIGAGIGAALWFVWVQVSSFMAGAYLTGRLRKRKHDATAHEVEIRIVRQTFDLWVIGDAYIELVKILLAREKRSIVEIHRRALDRDY